MEKVKLSDELRSTYNEFADVCNEHRLTFDSLTVKIGETPTGMKGLAFEIDLPSGLEEADANQIFETFIDNHPECEISYNKHEMTEIEKALKSMSETVIRIDEGLKPEKI